MLIHCSNWSITGVAFWLLAIGIRWFEGRSLCPEPFYPQRWAALDHMCPCWHEISVGGAFPRRSEAELMGTRMCLAWCNLAGKGGTASLGLAALPTRTSLPVLWCQTASGQAIGWRSVAQPAETCRRVPGQSGSCAGSANTLALGRWRWLWFPLFPSLSPGRSPWLG